ncbi:MAG: MBL fold metallo-hydrolase [Deltaproteobacteria bacterium]|nr:MBL fold metallo-hydrolase [Deltaproteobacteria bacterium]
MGISTVKPVPPQANQIEITLIGPGYGESTLVHIGNDKWVIIDSCIDSATSEPAAISYLRSIGVNPEISVVLIIATHWHDDHVRGISKVLESCPNAIFCASSVLSKEEFLNYVLPFDEYNPIAAGSGIKELKEMFRILCNKKRHKIGAIMNRRIYYIPASDTEPECSVWTLSPSDKQVDLFLNSLAELIPEVKTTKYRVVEPSDISNHLSIVTWIEVGDFAILLGGDKRETKDYDTGWSVIIKSKERPQRRACIYKVSHHGSSNAHNDGIWTEMLLSQPYALLTTYNRGRRKLPTSADVSRIETFTGNGYSTSRLSTVKSKTRRSPAVEKTIKGKIRIRSIQPRTGMIRLRQTINELGSWSVELSDSACKLKEVHS